MLGEWSGQSLSMSAVGTVPEHDGGLDSPRARWWSGQSASMMVVWTVPERKKSGKKTYATCTIILYIYLFTCSIKSSLTCLVKKVDGYSTSYCLLVFSSKQLRGTCK